MFLEPSKRKVVSFNTSPHLGQALHIVGRQGHIEENVKILAVCDKLFNNMFAQKNQKNISESLWVSFFDYPTATFSGSTRQLSSSPASECLPQSNLWAVQKLSRASPGASFPTDGLAVWGFQNPWLKKNWRCVPILSSIDTNSQRLFKKSRMKTCRKSQHIPKYVECWKMKKKKKKNDVAMRNCFSTPVFSFVFF